jgi:hypothetical protein
MEALTSYFDRLRVLIPARTLGLLLVGGTIAQTFTASAQSPTGLIVMSFVILGVCLLFNFLGGMITDKRPWHAALISSGALILFSLSQRSYGPLGALGVQEPWVYGTLAFIAAAYPLIIATFYRGAEPAVQAAQAARNSLRNMS